MRCSIIFFIFLNVIVYEDYTHTYTHMYKVKWNVKKWILKFSNFSSYVISIITWELWIRVWLVLSLNILLWLCLIIDYWFNFLSEYNNWFYCTVKFLMFFILVLFLFFLFFTSPYNLFVFQLIVTNWHLIFFFFTISLSLSIWDQLFSKIWWLFYCIKYAL